MGSGSLALLSFLPNSDVEVALKHNEMWFKEFAGYDTAYVRKAVAKSRKNGYAFVDGRIVPGMNAIGVPVFDTGRNVVAALSLAAISDRVSGERVESLVKILKKEAQHFGNALSTAPSEPIVKAV